MRHIFVFLTKVSTGTGAQEGQRPSFIFQSVTIKQTTTLKQSSNTTLGGICKLRHV